MKLYELLSKVSFDGLVTTLNTLVIKENQLPYFKMAFDELRMIAPTIDEDYIDVDSTDSYIIVEGCQDSWADVLGKNIRVEKELPLTDQVLAAHILWEITFFGFSEEEMKANIGRDYGDESHTPDNSYRRKIHKIEDKQWKNYSRGAKWEISEGQKFISYDIVMEIFKRRKKRNRAKRMRDARQERQMVQYGDEHTYSSRTNTSEDRTQYIIGLIDKYSDIDFSKYDSITAIATTSPGYPFSKEEKTLLQDYFSSKQRFKRMQIVFGSDPSVNSHQLTLLMIVSKD